MVISIEEKMRRQASSIVEIPNTNNCAKLLSISYCVIYDDDLPLHY